MLESTNCELEREECDLASKPTPSKGVFDSGVVHGTGAAKFRRGSLGAARLCRLLCARIGKKTCRKPTSISCRVCMWPCATTYALLVTELRKATRMMQYS